MRETLFAKKVTETVLNRHGLRLRCSRLMISQLVRKSQQDADFPEMLCAAIMEIENDGGPWGFRKPSQFRKLPLKGLFKGYFWGNSLISEMATNLLNENASKRAHGKLMKFMKAHEGELATNEHLRTLVAMQVDEALAERAERREITGEWIVFHKTNGMNLYLTLAGHREEDYDINLRAAMALREYGIDRDVPTHRA